jgi:hypothetical protein
MYALSIVEDEFWYGTLKNKTFMAVFVAIRPPHIELPMYYAE